MEILSLVATATVVLRDNKREKSDGSLRDSHVARITIRKNDSHEEIKRAVYILG
jgi:hypothetical protein